MKVRIVIGLMLCVLTLVGSAYAEVPPMYVITEIGTFGGHRSQARGINNAGQVVGWANDPGNWGQAFLWDKGTMTNLGTLGGNYSGAYAINESGQIVGCAAVDTHNANPFLWENGVMTDLGVLGSWGGSARDINESCQIVGNSNYSYSDWHAFLWENGTMTDLGGSNRSKARGINNHGLIVGSDGGGSTAAKAVIWENGVMSELPLLGGSLTRSQAYDVNDNGQITGISFDDTYSTVHGCLWENGQVIDLNIPGGGNSWAWAINESGQVIGEGYLPGAGGLRAFVWENGVTYNLNDLIPAEAGWTLWSAKGINDRGQIVGEGYTPSGSSRAYVLTPVIESVNATYLDSSFTPTGGEYGLGILGVFDEADIVVETAVGQTTYEDGSLLMATSLSADNSAGGMASGIFLGGEMIIKDADDADLLTGDLVSLELCEVIDGAGLLVGQGLFEITGGSLKEAFYLPYGEIIQITFHIDPADIDDFSGAFTGVSNITLTPVPEPATLSLLAVGTCLFLIRRKK